MGIGMEEGHACGRGRGRIFAAVVTAAAALALFSGEGAGASGNMPGAPAAAFVERVAAVENRSHPTLCAEVDNVWLAFVGDGIERFRITASHPAYIGTLSGDVTAPDFTDCDMSADPVYPAEARSVRIDVSDDVWLVGIAYPSFWRPADVPLIVDGVRHEGLHLVQLWVRRDGVAEEVLVVYPPDGYWRARPLGPTGFQPSPTAPDGVPTAYGSSFLVGPVTEEGRPVVALEEVRFDRDALAFDLVFAEGGTGRVAVETLDRSAQTLAVALDGVPEGLPFATLRSMYVTATNNDAAAVAWRDPSAAGWGEAEVMAFAGAAADRLWLGRIVPSRHNTSSPDHLVWSFSAPAR